MLASFGACVQWVNDQPLARPIPCTLANVWWFIDVAPEFITAFTRRAMLLAIDVVVFLPFEWMLRLYTCGAAAAMLLPIPTIVIALPFTAWVKRAIPFHSLFSLPRDSSPARLADYLSPLVIVHLLANRFFPTTSVATYSPYVLTYVAVTSLLDFSFLRLLVNILALVKESSLLEEISGPRLRSGCCGGSGRVCQCAVEIEVLKRQLAETKAEQKRAD
ncbi:hypothetical protein JCM8547_001303 [Rhodosporidiobolus lusitaniae]